MPTTDEKLLPQANEPKLLEPPKSQREAQHAKPGPSRTLVVLIAAGLLLLLAALFLFGYLRHHRTQQMAAAQAEREQRSLPTVNVAPVRRSAGSSDILLPGNITPLTEAFLYARASGYVRKRYVDIGDHVREGQLMAEIDSPDLDQQVAQGRAALAQSEQELQQTQAQLETSRSQLELARVTWERYQVLVQHGAIARQDADNQLTAFKSATSAVNASQANVSAAESNVRANRANVERLVALQGFEKVRAPFAGVVTARNFDVGALINGGGSASTGGATSQGGTQSGGGGGNAGTAGSSSLVSPSGGGAGGELFRVAQIGTLRILINAPQENAPTIHVGQPATVFIEEYSKQQFHGRVTRTANSIDPNTRTLLTEVQLANPQQILLPGTYAQVQLSSARTNPPLLIPGDSIITTANGIEVAILEDLKPDDKDKQGRPYPANAKRLHIQKVEVGRDYGPELEVTRGLAGWEYVVVNPSDVVEEGAVVQPVAAAIKPPRAGQPARRGPSDKTPTGITPASPGAADSGGRGASTKGGGGK